MSGIPVKSLFAALAVMALFALSHGATRVAHADTPTPVAGEVIIHKHCTPEDAEGTFTVAIDFSFTGDVADLGGVADPQTAFDISDLSISCGDDDSTTDDGDTISVGVGTDLSALVTWYNTAGVPDAVETATVTIRETGLPDDVTATYAGCDFDETDIAGISSGWVCVITNDIEEPDDDGNGDGDGADCPCPGQNLDIDNTNTNVIGIDNDNTNNNANDNNNENENENENANENNNTNTNTQNQTNEQDQDNNNTQTNNIDASPEVNISGVAGAAPKPGGIKPPSTGDAGLAAPAPGAGNQFAQAVLLGAAVMLGAAVAGRAAFTERR